MTNKVKPLTTFLKRASPFLQHFPVYKLFKNIGLFIFSLLASLLGIQFSIFFQPTHFFTLCGGYLPMRRRVLLIICAIGLNAINRAE